jgi:hypothetical protein
VSDRGEASEKRKKTAVLIAVLIAVSFWPPRAPRRIIFSPSTTRQGTQRFAARGAGRSKEGKLAVKR